MATVGGDRTPFTAPHGDSCLLHQTPRFVPSHGIPVGLELLGHAPTPITVARLGRNCLHPCHQGDLCPVDLDCGLSLPVGIKPAATHLQHLAQHCNRPCILVLSHKGIFHF